MAGPLVTEVWVFGILISLDFCVTCKATAASEQASGATNDGDGDNDTFQAQPGSIQWHEYSGTEFITHTIPLPTSGQFRVWALDIDADEDIDFVGFPNHQRVSGSLQIDSA